jgi:RHS repeat-associated protein
VERGLADPTFTFPEREVDAFGRAVERRFDPRTGLMVSAVDPNGAAVEFESDGFGRRLAEWGPLDSRARPTVAFRYDTAQLPAHVVRWARETSGVGERAGTAGCLESEAFFDGLGRLLEIASESAAGRVVTRAVTYDAAGRIVLEAEPFAAAPGGLVPVSEAPYVRRYEYDPAGRLVAAANARGETAHEDHTGWTTSRIDAMGHRRDITQDAFGQIVMVREFEGSGAAAMPRPPAAYRYDAAGRLSSIIDPAGIETTLSYDALGRRIALADPHAGDWAYRFDLQGNLVEEVDPQGRVTTMSYDALDRPAGKILADGRQFTWRWDEGGAAARALGRLTTALDPTGSTTWAYDSMGRVLSESRALYGTTWTTSTAWDAMGRIVSRTLPGGVRADYQYDAGGQLAAVPPYAPRIDHNERGQITTVLYAGGARAERLWDQATGRPTGLVVLDGAGARVGDFAWSTDADGFVTTAEDRSQPGTTTRRSYIYDARHRLVHAEGPFGAIDYGYDDAGTMTRMGTVSLYQDDARHPQRITRTSAGVALDYDAAGDLTSLTSPGGSRVLSYDVTGRLARLQDAARGVTVTSDYDAGGRLVREVTDRSGAASVLLLPFPGLEVRDGLASSRVFAGDLAIATVESDGRVLFPIADPSGTPLLVLNGQGALAGRASFDPFGKPLDPGPAGAASALRFAGARPQDATGLMVMGWRHYDPALGRFLEPDPVLAAVLDPQSLHRYAYARNNPVNLSDPDGKSPIAAILFIGALALLDRDTRIDVASSVALTAATIFLTGALGPGAAAGVTALKASIPALYASAASTVILDSRLGRGLIEGYAQLFEDLGLSDRGSQAASRLLSSWLLNSSLQHGFGRLLAPAGPALPGDPLGDRAALDGALASRGLDPGALGSPTGDAYGTTVKDTAGTNGGHLELDRFRELRDAQGRVVGVYGVRDLGRFFDHGAAAVFDGQAGAAMSQAHFAYGLGGISTQQFARDLFAAGYSGSLYTLTGRASDFLIEFVYGPYGGGLAFGIGLAASAGAPAGGGP